MRRALAAALAIAACTTAAAQMPLGTEARDLRVYFATAALDNYLETWNSRDPRQWASSLHFPHVRPGPGTFELSRTPEQYAAGVNFAATLATGWHHSERTSRRVLQVGLNTVHIAGSWTRYTVDGRALTGSAITYIITNKDGRWGVLSRFAAGPTGLAGGELETNRTAAAAAVEAYYVRIADGAVELFGLARGDAGKLGTGAAADLVRHANRVGRNRADQRSRGQCRRRVQQARPRRRAALDLRGSTPGGSPRRRMEDSGDLDNVAVPRSTNRAAP
jgi:hypothetical protein